ncbi:MAG: FG-GAP-like repeat-containing protein [Bryobacteraceae bacterium]|nr:FG-GAP-like repeat-containing protein [Bryobacteraceae bacterium]MCX7605317.1 FG-GAP-like repeat-containing protein [Bryobacteraceae bacterium]
MGKRQGVALRTGLIPAAAALALAAALLAQHEPGARPGRPAPAPLPEKSGPLRKAQLLLREGRTEEARRELQRLLQAGAGDAMTWYQLARSYLLDFYSGTDYAKRRTALNLAMEALGTALRRDPDHIPSLKAKAVIHARAELLYYDPNLAYELAARVARLEPNAYGFLLNLSDWMSGEVRFTKESGNRVPHDPLIGLDRSIDLLEQVIDGSMPYSNEELSALATMAKTLVRRGNFQESLLYFRQALARTKEPVLVHELLREMGTAYYRMGDFNEAARLFYQALQVNNNNVDQWLLKVAMDQIPGEPPPIPKQFLFPARPLLPRAGENPLLEFEDIAPRLGIDRYDGNGTAAWADYDGDGDLDLFESGSGEFIRLFRNDGRRFADATAEAGLDRVPSGYSLNLVDFDNDGRPDLYISMNGWSGPMKNRLFRNIGGRFEDVTEKSGAGDPGDGFVSLWADFDNDGWLDLAIANGVLKDGSVPQIYRNNGDGTFTNMTQQAGIAEPPEYGTIGIALGDYDRDGRVDILINGLDPAPNRLYRNLGNWKFRDVAREAGLVQPPHNGFVCFLFDYNNDGYPDALTTSLAAWESVVAALRLDYVVPKTRVHPDSSRLFRNNRDGTFTDVTFEAGLHFPMGVMGAGVADLDNDGWLDLYLGVGDPQLSRLEPNRFFRNNGDGTFSDLTDFVKFQRPGNKGHGVAFIDWEEDGDLDIYAQLGGHYPGDHARNAFYRNLKANRNSWLQVDLKAVKSNRDAIGAQLTVRAGPLTVYREAKGSEGFGATSQRRQHFGLGQAKRIDSLEIRWPSGVVQKIEALDANQIIEVEEGRGWRRVK